MAEKEGGIVKKGHEEGMKMANALLEEFDFPLGLLPLENVIEAGFVKSTGYMWIVQQKKIKKLKGVKAKEFMLWPPVSEIIVDDHPPTGKIHFKSLAGVTKTFPIEAFILGE